MSNSGANLDLIRNRFQNKSNKGLDQNQKSTIEIEGQSYAITPIQCLILKDNPFQYRKTYDEDTIRELSENIGANRLYHPIVVGEYQGEKIVIVGHRRLRAVQLLGWSKIPAINIGKVNNEVLVQAVYSENEHRENVHPIETAFSIDKIIRESKITAREFAKLIGKSEKKISSLRGLLRLSDKIKEDLQKNESTWDIWVIERISSIKSHEQQEWLYFNYIKDGKADREWLTKEIKCLKDNDAILKDKQESFKLYSSKTKRKIQALPPEKRKELEIEMSNILRKYI